MGWSADDLATVAVMVILVLTTIVGLVLAFPRLVAVH